MNKPEILEIYNTLLSHGTAPKEASQVTIEILIDDVPDGYVSMAHAASLLGINGPHLCRHCTYQHIKSYILPGITRPCFRRVDLPTFAAAYPNYKDAMA